MKARKPVRGHCHSPGESFGVVAWPWVVSLWKDSRAVEERKSIEFGDGLRVRINETDNELFRKAPRFCLARPGR